jgi:hypothetical protein
MGDKAMGSMTQDKKKPPELAGGQNQGKTTQQGIAGLNVGQFSQVPSMNPTQSSEGGGGVSLTKKPGFNDPTKKMSLSDQLQSQLASPLGFGMNPKIPSLATEKASIEKAAADIDQLISKMNSLSGMQMKPPITGQNIGGTTHIESSSIGLKLNAVNKDPKSFKQFLIDFSALLGTLCVGGFAQEIPGRGVQGAVNLYKDVKLDAYLKSLGSKVGPWRNNQNEWYTDFFGHTMFGYAMASFFKERGYSAFVSWLATAVADFVWEFGIEGAHARSEWNDYLTTTGIGAISAALGQSINVGPIQMRPGVTYDPASGKLGIGVSITQALGKGKSIALSVSKAGDQLTTSAEYNLSKNISISGSMSGGMGKKGFNQAKIALNIKI